MSNDKQKGWLASTAIALLMTLVAYLVCEGLYAVRAWDQADGSLGYRIYALVRERIATARVEREQPVLPVATVKDFEALLPDMKAAAVGIGDSPFSELITDRAAVNQRSAAGCLQQKPNLDKMVTALRSNAFNPFEPPSFFVDADKRLSPALDEFLSRYAVRRLHHRSNAFGERVTLPAVERPRKVLIAGDSVANGLMVDDSETLASQLQAGDGERQYVNLGVAGADAPDILCALEDAAKRYAGAIDELIYIYCENDLKPGQPLGDPEAVMAALGALVQREKIAKVTVVYAPYIYNVMPALTRFKGHRGFRRPYHAEERATLAKLVEQAGFRHVDIGAQGMAENQRLGSDFSAFALYVDQVHLSPQGTALLAAKLRAP
ncbi:MAG: SGNH/GDSL hydrolase family protein [Proteobacteria bacterium]|nr:SGNH/GDSL hydrolase family protein [Pseudomonadota bacterium]